MDQRLSEQSQLDAPPTISLMNLAPESQPSLEEEVYQESAAAESGQGSLITQVNPDDVLFGRGSHLYNHVGNRQFRDDVERRKDEYLAATKEQKREIARQVLSEVFKRGGRFLQMTSSDVDGAYERVDETKEITKCLHALREKKRVASTPSRELRAEQTQRVGARKRDCPGDIATDLEIVEQPLSVFCSVKGKDQETEGDTVAKLDSNLSDSNRPRMTLEREQIERELLTKQEKVEAVVDLFGKYCNFEDQKVKRTRSDRYVKSAVEMMRHEIEWIPKEEKSALLEAQSMCCPDEFSDKKMESFLCCVDWHPKRAAERLVNYWEKRRQLFGLDKFLLPMTLSGALRDDLKALETGVCCPLPYRDASGRQLIWYRLARNTFDGYTAESMLRVLWYIYEVASQQDNENKGIVRLAYYKDATKVAIDVDLFCEHQVLTKDCWPIKLMADHNICVSRENFQLVVPHARASKGRELRLRAVFHDGSHSEIRNELANYGIFKDMLPSDVGGTVEFCIDEWITARRTDEEKTSSDHLETFGEDFEDFLEHFFENEVCFHAQALE